ncbi:unnamed protein product [Caenorhabditis brenneri]
MSIAPRDSLNSIVALISKFNTNLDFGLKNAPSESIQELLNRCNGENTSLYIRTKIPEGFKCTPPLGGFKFETLSVNYALWVNMDDFLQCRKLAFFLCSGFDSGVLEWLIEEDSQYGIAIERIGRQELQFQRKDGLKMLVCLSCGCLILEDDYL